MILLKHPCYNIDTIKNTIVEYDLKQLDNTILEVLPEDVMKIFNKYDSNKAVIDDPYKKLRVIN